MKTGEAQALHSAIEVQQSLFCTSGQDSLCAGKRELSPPRFSASTSFVDDDLIGSEFFRQQNGVSFAGVEEGQLRVGRVARRLGL